MSCFRAFGLLLAITAWAADGERPPACRLSGGVVSAITGEPLNKVELTLSSIGSDNSYTAPTDAAGAFALVGLEAGRYELLVQKRGFVQYGQTLTLSTGQSTTGMVVRMTPQGVVTGRVMDRDGDPIAGATVQAIQSRFIGSRREYAVSGAAITNDIGEYRIYGLNPGRYHLGAGYRSETGYAAVYFPNVPEASRAIPVDVAPGGELQGIDLKLPEAHSTRIRGIVRGAAGLPVKGIMIVALPCDAGPLNRATTVVGASDGVFELRDVTPGCYLLAADTFNSGKRFSARLPLTVAGKNIEDVKLNLAAPVHLFGRIRIEKTPDFPFQQVVVNLEARTSRLTAGGAANQDGNLSLDNIVPQAYDLNVIVPDGYYVKSARYGQLDVLHAGLDLSYGAAGQLEVEIGTDGGRIEGLVDDGSDLPVDGARVVLMPVDPTAGQSQRKVTVTNPKGAFSIRGIAPGDYDLYASRNLDAAALQDPVNLDQIKRYAKSISVHADGLETLQVKAIPSR